LPGLLEGLAKGLHGERHGDFFIKSSDMAWATGFFQRNEDTLKLLSHMATGIGVEGETLQFWLKEENPKPEKVIEALDIATRIARGER
ncbi:MAG: hypothetical protein V1909_05170, partial [Candidatus Micrarchaeota archaeon]